MTKDRFPKIGGKFAEKYRLLEKLKESENVAIYHAVEIAYDRDVTLKVIANPDADAFESFQKNSKLFSKLKNPFTSTLFFFGKSEDVLYLALEFIEGEDLRSFLHPNPRPGVESVVNIFRQALFSLREAHALGIVHGDLKLKNIMVIANDEDEVLIKIRDFQLVNFSSTWFEKDAEDISFKKDIEALGRILLSLLVGSPTTSNTFPNQVEVPIPLKRIITKMLAPNDAYEDVDTILSDLGSPTLLDAISDDPKKTKKIYFIGFALLALIFGTLAWTVLFFSETQVRPDARPFVVRSPESRTLKANVEVKEVPTPTKRIKTPIAHESYPVQEIKKPGGPEPRVAETRVKKSAVGHRPKKKKKKKKKKTDPPKNEVAKKEEPVEPNVAVIQKEIPIKKESGVPIKKAQPLKFMAKVSEKTKKTPKKKDETPKKKVTPQKVKKIEEKKSAPISF